MKSWVLLFVLSCFAAAGVVLYDACAQFEKARAKQEHLPSSLRSAMSQAKAENKNVLAIFISDGCGPCKRMKEEVLPSPEIQAFADKFVWVVLTPSFDNNPAIREYGIEGVPSFLILDGSGRELNRAVGGYCTADFAAFLGRNEMVRFQK